MVKSEWYTNRTWNGAIDSKFEKYLKHTRDAANKAAFMQIQGSLLLDNPQPNIQNVGVALLTRLIEDFPAEHTSVIAAQEKLGGHYLKQNDFKQAAFFYRIVVAYCIQQNSRSGTSLLADIKLAESLLKSNKDEVLEEAYQLIKAYPVDSIKLMDTKFYYTQLAAQVCDVMNKTGEATKFALEAIALPKLAKPAFKEAVTNNTIIGRQLRTVEQIAAGV